MKLKYNGRWLSPNEVDTFRAWMFHIWNDYESWHCGVAIDGIRICGFEWNNWW